MNASALSHRARNLNKQIFLSRMSKLDLMLRDVILLHAIQSIRVFPQRFLLFLLTCVICCGSGTSEASRLTSPCSCVLSCPQARGRTSARSARKPSNTNTISSSTPGCTRGRSLTSATSAGRGSPTRAPTRST